MSFSASHLFDLGQAVCRLLNPAFLSLQREIEAASSEAPWDTRPRQTPSSEQVTPEAQWAIWRLLEAGNWICLGVDLGCYPIVEARRILEVYFGLGLPGKDEPSRRYEPRVQDRFGALQEGNVDVALSLRRFKEVPEITDELRHAFQTALILAQRAAADTRLQTFLRLLTLADQSAWNHEVDRQFSLVEAAVQRRGASASSFAEFTSEPLLLDDLLLVLGFLNSLSGWARATFDDDWDLSEETPFERLSAMYMDPAKLAGPPHPDYPAARVLVHSVGEIQRWRLRPDDRRLLTLAQRGDRLLPAVLRFTGRSDRSRWSEGLSVSLRAALNDWQWISGDYLGGFTDPGDSGPGSSGSGGSLGGGGGSHELPLLGPKL